MKLKRAYIEITNCCNLQCSFCPGTRRPPRTMTVPEFRHIGEKLRHHADYFYLHVMGEPLLHPQLDEILEICLELGVRVCLTTNGTLLEHQRGCLLQASALHKVSLSLHSMEGNGVTSLENYLESVWDFSAAAASRGIIACLRLWNIGGADSRNQEILAFLGGKTGYAPMSWPQPRLGSWRLEENLYLEQAEKFDWPDLNAPEQDAQFCYALRSQVAVLCDGTVVPCCLDHEGDIPLGNLFAQSLEEILASPRAEELYQGFTHRRPTEELCRRCGYAARFNR